MIFDQLAVPQKNVLLHTPGIIYAIYFGFDNCVRILQKYEIRNYKHSWEMVIALHFKTK